MPAAHNSQKNARPPQAQADPVAALSRVLSDALRDMMAIQSRHGLAAFMETLSMQAPLMAPGGAKDILGRLPGLYASQLEHIGAALVESSALVAQVQQQLFGLQLAQLDQGADLWHGKAS